MANGGLAFRDSFPSFFAFGLGLEACGVAGAVGCGGDVGRPLVAVPAGAVGGGIERC